MKKTFRTFNQHQAHHSYLDIYIVLVASYFVLLHLSVHTVHHQHLTNVYRRALCILLAEWHEMVTDSASNVRDGPEHIPVTKTSLILSLSFLLSLSLCEVKGVPLDTIRHAGREDAGIHSFLDSALDAGKCSASGSSHCTPEKKFC